MPPLTTLYRSISRSAARAGGQMGILLGTLVGTVAAVAPAAAASSGGAAFPERPIQLIVGFTAGSAPDVLARVLAEGWKRNGFAEAVVVNQPGAGGSLGVAQVARAAPDGHTLAVAGDAALLVNPTLYPDLPLNVPGDLSPVSQLIVSPTMLVVGKDSPARSVADLVAAARAAPGSASFASAGAGTSSRRNGELLRRATGLPLLHVPYNANPLVDVAAGRVTMFFANVANSAPLIADGRLRPLAIAGPARLPRWPEVPTMAEAGYPQVDSLAWFGLVAPAGTPADRLERLQAEAARVLQDPAFAPRIEALGGSLVLSTPAAFRALVEAELPRWRAFVKELGLKAD